MKVLDIIEHGAYVVFVLRNILKALVQVVFGMYDQTHYHTTAFKLHCGIALNIMWHYLRSIPINFMTHWDHGRILHTMGLSGVENLKDTGSLVWCPLTSEGNILDYKPAARVTGLLNNSSGNPAHLSLPGSSLDAVWTGLLTDPFFRYENCVFLDFGCGTGFPLLVAMTKPFQRIVGVELNAHCAALALQNAETFAASTHRKVAIRCPNVTVHCMDMSDFDYSSLLGSTTNSKHGTNGTTTSVATINGSLISSKASNEPPTIVLYMYEPLWTLRKADAHLIYTRILRRAQQCGHPVLVAYFYCGVYNGDALPALQGLGAELLYTRKCASLNFASDADFFLYKLC